MTRRAVLACLVAATWTGAAVGARAAGQGDTLKPAQMVRSLQLVQDRVADGDHAALPMQKKLLEMIDKRFRGVSQDEMNEPASFRALLIYSMSGGNPKTLKAVLERVHLDEEDSRKAIGVLSYLTGGTRGAAIALKNVDPMKEPPELGAFLALVRGAVVSLEDAKSALKFLDQARLLSPGTLVEEAALRRSIPLAAGEADTARFLLASEQYVRTYLRSPYASQFADGFVAGVIALHETIDLDHVATIVDLMTPEQQKVIYLRIARRSAIDGLKALSQFASQRVAPAEASAAADDDPRALLYSTLSNVATEPAEQLRANLARIDRARLSAGDLKLLDAVTAVSEQMMGAAVPSDGMPAEAPEAVADPAVPAVAESPAPDTAVPDIAVPETAAPAVRTVGAPSSPASADAQAEAATDAPVDAPEQTEAAAPERADEPLPPIPETAPATAAQDSAQAPAAETASDAPQDPADEMVALGRKKLAEIDQLLEKAAK